MENITYYSEQITNKTIEWVVKEEKKEFYLVNDGEITNEINIHKIDCIYKHVIRIDGPIIPRFADVVCDFKFIISKKNLPENLTVKLEIGGEVYSTDAHIQEIKNNKNEITFPRINAPIPLIHMQYREVKVIPNFEYLEMYATYLYLPHEQRRYIATRPSIAFGFNFRFMSKDGCCYKNGTIFKDFDMVNRTLVRQEETYYESFYDFMNFPFDKKIKFREIFMIF